MIPVVYKYIGIALVFLALLVALMLGVNNYNAKQREAGANECRTAIATATATAVAEARDRERIARDRVSDINKRFDETKQELNNEKTHNVAAARDGSLRLRDTNGACISGRAEVGASASGDSKATGCELSKESAEFLLSEAARADEIVLQLKAAQQLLESDRKTVNGK